MPDELGELLGGECDSGESKNFLQIACRNGGSGGRHESSRLFRGRPVEGSSPNFLGNAGCQLCKDSIQIGFPIADQTAGQFDCWDYPAPVQISDCPLRCVDVGRCFLSGKQLVAYCGFGLVHSAQMPCNPIAVNGLVRIYPNRRPFSLGGSPENYPNRPPFSPGRNCEFLPEESWAPLQNPVPVVLQIRVGYDLCEVFEKRKIAAQVRPQCLHSLCHS